MFFFFLVLILEVFEPIFLWCSKNNLRNKETIRETELSRMLLSYELW